MAKGRSTSDNPAEAEKAALGQEEINSEEALGTDGAEAAGIERASVVAAVGVKYVGAAHIREISGRDWTSAGITGQTKAVWDNRVGGKNVLPITDFTPEALEYLDRIDDGFVLVDEKGKQV